MHTVRRLMVVRSTARFARQRARVVRGVGLVLALSLVAAHFASPALQAAVTTAKPDGFVLTVTVELAAPPARVYAALGQVERWWSPSHTWSGDIQNLSVALEAGSCFCERWQGSTVEHARVLFAKKDQELRFGGALGPLQEMAVTGVVTFKLQPSERGTKLEVIHRVSGDTGHGLDVIAPFADKMLMETLGRFEKFVATGKAE
jgi:uncharacterized protein YndB with AHSA1/START domain